MIMEEKTSLYQMRFPQKLWYLINLRTDAVIWGGTGRTILLNYNILAKYMQCNHSIFKTNNISSFVRQLNLYGFRKVTSHLQDPLCNSSNPYMHEYAHDYFQYGRPELLNRIIRKPLMKKSSSSFKYNNDGTRTGSISPLIKARHTFKIALKKAFQSFYLQRLPRTNFNMQESQGDQTSDEQEPYSWTVSFVSEDTDDSIEVPAKVKEESDEHVTSTSANWTDEEKDEESYSTTEIIEQPSELNVEKKNSIEDKQENSANQYEQFELLAEFNIEDIGQDMTMKKNVIETMNSMSCVLPSVTESIEDFVLAERNGYSSLNNGEWDQIFNEIAPMRSTEFDINRMSFI